MSAVLKAGARFNSLLDLDDLALRLRRAALANDGYAHKASHPYANILRSNAEEMRRAADIIERSLA